MSPKHGPFARPLAAAGEAAPAHLTDPVSARSLGPAPAALRSGSAADAASWSLCSSPLLMRKLETYFQAFLTVLPVCWRLLPASPQMPRPSPRLQPQHHRFLFSDNFPRYSVSGASCISENPELVLGFTRCSEVFRQTDTSRSPLGQFGKFGARESEGSYVRQAPGSGWSQGAGGPASPARSPRVWWALGHFSFCPVLPRRPWSLLL